MSIAQYGGIRSAFDRLWRSSVVVAIAVIAGVVRWLSRDGRTVGERAGSAFAGWFGPLAVGLDRLMDDLGPRRE